MNSSEELLPVALMLVLFARTPLMNYSSSLPIAQFSFRHWTVTSRVTPK